ncbi:hypothetical protein, partial [Proteus mirabilis]|uniref:hypothetical protein n=1 Tax=Proteus mirabilis TaxID=584 RepID=UPI001C12F152
EVLPRVGDEYQAEIPSLITISDYLKLSKDPADSEIAADDSPDRLIGMSVPVIWIRDEKIQREEGFD